MPNWLLRLIWRVRGKRRVRLHLLDVEHSIGGVLLGVVGGHYLLAKPKLIEAEDRTIPLDGLVEVPRERVLLVQVL